MKSTDHDLSILLQQFDTEKAVDVRILEWYNK